MKSILLVEDDPDIRSSLDWFLKNEGFPVILAENGKVALEELKKNEKNEPGLVLLDLMMPVMNGWEFLDKKNETTAISKIPVLVISAVAGDPYIKGTMGFMKKPIDLNRLIDFAELYCA